MHKSICPGTHPSSRSWGAHRSHALSYPKKSIEVQGQISSVDQIRFLQIDELSALDPLLNMTGGKKLIAIDCVQGLSARYEE